MKRVLIIAGPNGAGKTTFARTYLAPLYQEMRFSRGLKMFNAHYKDAVDAWALYDNSGVEPKLIEWGEN